MRIWGVVLIAAVGCGGGGGGGDDAMPDARGILEVFPNRQSNSAIWRHDPIELRFTPPIDPATITDESVVITVGGIQQARTVTVERTSGDAAAVAIAIDWGATEPDSPTTATITLADSLRGEGGEPFVATSYSYQYSAWNTLAEDVNGAEGAGAPVFAIGADGTPAVAYATGEPGVLGGKVNFATLGAGDRWTGAFVNTAYLARNYDVLVDSQGRTVVAVAVPQDSGSVNHTLRVERDFERLEGSTPLANVLPIGRVRLLRDGDSTIVAWRHFGGVRAFRWDDSTQQWVQLARLDPIGGVQDFDIALDQGVPIIAYILNANPDGLHVARRAATTTTWTELASPLYRYPPTNPQSPQLVVGNGTAYVAWREAIGGQGYNLFAARIALPGLTATNLDGPIELDAVNDVSAPSLALTPGGTLYTAFTEIGASQSLHVRRLSGTSWETVGQSLNMGEARSVAIEIGVHRHPMILHGGDRIPDAQVRLVRHNGAPAP